MMKSNQRKRQNPDDFLFKTTNKNLLMITTQDTDYYNKKLRITSGDPDYYLDSLYSDHHVQYSNEELLLPLETFLPPAYPTALLPPKSNYKQLQTQNNQNQNQSYQNQNYSPSGMVSHVDNNYQASNNNDFSTQNDYFPPQIPDFHPSNFLSVPINKKFATMVPSNYQNAEPIKRSRANPSMPKSLSILSPPGVSLFEATYSGVDVYELIVNGHSLMRRRDDSWVNATHILKIANVEKGRRTKILEREVHHEQHEKVQGGYGKYQGTWIPCERARSLARDFQVYDYCASILDLP